MIDRSNKLPPSLDFSFLKAEGIKLIENLSGKVWNDYNTHDPGITLLEMFCYVLTDLGYRTSFDIADLLATKESPPSKLQKDIYTATQILPCNPVTLNDFRKLVIDTKGVRNAWIEISDSYEIPIYLHLEKERKDSNEQKINLTYDAKKGDDILSLRGLYKVFVEYETHILEERREEEIADIIRKKLHFHRNLCEDFISVNSIEYELFAIEAILQVSEGTDIDKINARVYEVINSFFSPPVLFYSLEQMLQKGYSAEEIFEGPILKYGFIDTAEMEKSERYKQIHLSDIVGLISDIEGVIAVKKLALPIDSESPFSDFTEWIDNVKSKQKAPRLDVDNSKITFVRSGDRYRNEAEKYADKKRVKALFSFAQSSKLQSRLKGYAGDFKIPTGEYMNVKEYFPMQKSLPAAYKMSESYFDNNVNEDTIVKAVLRLDSHKVRQPNNVSADTMTLLGEAASKILGKSLARIKEEGGIAEEQINAIHIEYRNRQVTTFDKRKKQTVQLRGFLMVFEQIAADYLSQLANARNLFSLDQAHVKQTFFPQQLEGIEDLEFLFLDYKKYKETLLKITETEEEFYRRSNIILDHLIARYSESFEKYSFYMQSTLGREVGKKLIGDKTNFLSDYIQISNYRGKGFDYTNSGDKQENGWNSDNVEGFKKRICRLLGIPDYTRKSISTDIISIEEIKLDNEIVRYKVILTDPANKKGVLLESNEYETPGEADDILNYILKHGFDRNLYEKEDDRNTWFYRFKKRSQEEDYTTVATSAIFSKTDDEDNFLEKTLSVLNTISQYENFHVLEHILLRPKMPPRQRTVKRGASHEDSDIVRLLPALEVTNKERFVKTQQETSPYKFNIVNIPDPDNGNRIFWKVGLIKEDNSEVLKVNEEFLFYKNLMRRIDIIRDFASDRSNYIIDQNADGYYIFRISEQDRLLAASSKNYRKKEDLDAEIEKLIDFFSYEGKIQQEENVDEDLSSYADPYSFQVSVFIPTWPARFRDPTFKHLLEKTIYMETPCHIYPHVYWLDHSKMKQFEEAYKLWIRETTSKEVPDTELVNNLILVLNEIRNHL